MQYATTRSILRWIHIVFSILSGKHIAIGPLGWLERGPAASLLVRYGLQQLRSSLTHSILSPK
jgi:hypothetical protein